MKTTRLIFCILLTALVLAAALFMTTGCGAWLMNSSSGTVSQPPDPLVGWKSVGPIGYKVGYMSATVDSLPGYTAISDDVQIFVNKLPVDTTRYDPNVNSDRRYCYWLEHITLFANGTGQHAVDMQMEFGGLGLRYVLFYDKSNARIKVVKIEWHYQS